MRPSRPGDIAEPTEDDLVEIQALREDLARRLADMPVREFGVGNLTPLAESIIDDVSALLASPRTAPLAGKMLTEALRIIATTILNPPNAQPTYGDD